MRRAIIIIDWLCVLAAASAGTGWPAHTASAQTSKHSYRGGTLILDHPKGVRAGGMAETGVADYTDPANIYFNPANVVSLRRAYIHGSTWEWIDGISVTAGGAGGCWTGAWGERPLTFGVDVSAARLDVDLPERTIYFPEGMGGRMPDEYFLSLALGAGVLIEDRWDVRLGTAGRRYWTDDVGDETLDGLGFDFGATIAYRAVVSEWRVVPAAAMAFVDVGSSLRETDTYIVKMPTRFHYGLSIRVESPATRINGATVPVLSFTSNVDGVDRFHGARSSWAFAGEFALAEILFLRAGAVHDEKLHDGQTASSPYSSLGVGLGLPVRYLRVRFDYARLPNLDEQNRYGVSLTWAI